MGKRGGEKVSKIINENSIEWVDIKCAIFAASIKQEERTIPNKMFNCSKKMSFFVFWEKFSAFVETTIKMFGINGLKGDNFQFNFRNIRAPTKRLNMQKYHVFLPCLQISSTMMHNVHLVEICCSICKKSSIQAFHFHLEHVKGAAS